MTFKYEVCNKSGQSFKGEIEADNQPAAIKSLREQGFYILEIKNKTTFSGFNILKNRIPLREKIIFTQQLGIMIKAGLPLIEALATLQDQTSNKALAKIISSIIADVKGGEALSKALAKHPSVFPRLYSNVVSSGEKTGKLEEVMQRLSEQMIRDYDLVSKVRTAMYYPAFILTALVGVIIMILIYVIPQLQKIFEEVEVPLPITTRALLFTSNAVKYYWWLLLIFIVAVYLLIKRLAKNEQVALYLDKIKLKMPIFGPLFMKVYMARFSRTMATLIAAGLPMLDVFDTVADVLNNKVLQQSLKNASKQVEAGMTLSSILMKDPNFPPMVSRLISVGEKSGNIDFVLAGTADFYDKEVDNATKSLSSLIEPILMIIMGIGVFLVLTAVIMPIYSLVNVI
ncbi:MAG: hypothetical protein COU44_01730 [Candidatus Nealsonbacteria bacterium CG10_big_fil_rev_8_21_14_0_10_40_24]|nr:MAG: hypothetical protein COU44_01730 [Candidatus Nealsonbacteria bacterium CG10_big_fil_rev_8_21_14_0_10_40_24]